MPIPYLFSSLLLVCVMAELLLRLRYLTKLNVIKINLHPNQFLTVDVIPPVFHTLLHPNNTLFRRTSGKNQAIVYESNAVFNVGNTGDESLSRLVVWSSNCQILLILLSHGKDHSFVLKFTITNIYIFIRRLQSILIVMFAFIFFPGAIVFLRRACWSLCLCFCHK